MDNTGTGWECFGIYKGLGEVRDGLHSDILGMVLEYVGFVGVEMDYTGTGG